KPETNAVKGSGEATVEKTDLSQPAREYSDEEKKLEKFLYNAGSSGNYMPSPRDVVQKDEDYGLNNCYMLGVLIALAERDPKFIKEKLIKLSGKDIIVSLYDYETKVNDEKGGMKQYKQYVYPLEKHEYKLSTDEIEESNIGKWGKHKAKWVFAVEIAFAKLLRDDHAGGEFKESDALDEVLRKPKQSSIATTVITGKNSKLNTFPEFSERQPLKKFPEGANYNEYCIKIRDRILKHLSKSEDASGVMVAAFDGLSNSAISKNKIYKLIKEDPQKWLLGNKTIKDMLREGHTDLSVHCIDFIEGDTPFCESNMYTGDILWDTLVPCLLKHIEEPSFKKFKDLILNVKPNSRWYKLRDRLRDDPKLLEPLDEEWVNEAKKDEEYGSKIEEFLELMTMKKEDFIKSKYFDRVLKLEAAPYLSQNLKGPEYEQFRKRMNLVSFHSYTVLNCFEDKDTKYWYVTLQNAWGRETKIDYSKSKRAKTVKLPPDPVPGAVNVFNMELAHFCKYLRGLSYDKNPK
ncbi:MAG: hypothetical protein Q4D57_06475, partial [Clostridia bacterium]|nr:hypothetical protein [Clostridia bacterium]